MVQNGFQGRGKGVRLDRQGKAGNAEIGADLFGHAAAGGEPWMIFVKERQDPGERVSRLMTNRRKVRPAP